MTAFECSQFLRRPLVGEQLHRHFPPCQFTSNHFGRSSKFFGEDDSDLTRYLQLEICLMLPTSTTNFMARISVKLGWSKSTQDPESSRDKVRLVVCCYLDILGFRELVEESRSDWKLARKVIDYIDSCVNLSLRTIKLQQNGYYTIFF